MENKKQPLHKVLVKKLNNFSLTSLCISLVSLLAVLGSLAYLAVYEFAGEYDTDLNMQITAFADRPIHGMIFFLAGLISIILGIAVIYNSLAAIMNRDVVQIKKMPLYLTIANGVFQIIMAIMTVILLVSGEPIKTSAGFIVCLVVSVITAIGCFLTILPTTMCEFYMPPIRGTKK